MRKLNQNEKEEALAAVVGAILLCFLGWLFN